MMGEGGEMRTLMTEEERGLSRINSYRRYAKSNKCKIKFKRYRLSDKGRDSRRKSAHKWCEKNKNKIIARKIAEKYITKICKCEIVLCNEDGVKHHEDYSKPLEVNWLCDSHHIQYHRNDKNLEDFKFTFIMKILGYT